MNPVQIVTIANKIPLYKGEDQADKIELITFEENGFEVVAQKNLYEVGDRAIYIQPDYNLSDLPIFDSFTKPNGDESKSMLGKVNGKPCRIRAKKFNLHRGDGIPVYSNGILLPQEECLALIKTPIVPDYINSLIHYDWEQILQITKYSEPEDKGGGLKTGATKPFPVGIYKTDEENIHNLWSGIQFPITLVGLEKVDGSSITIGIKNGEPFICSRKLSKPLTRLKVVGRRNKTWIERLMFWKKHDLLIKEEVVNDDDFVKYGKPYLDRLIEMGLDDIVFRGELCGGSMKGSGNKLNPESKNPVNIKWFGLDWINEGIANKANYYEFIGVIEIVNSMFISCKKVFAQEFNSREDLMKACNNYFETQTKFHGRTVEGIVVRTLDSKFSAKIMNNEYDSKK